MFPGSERYNASNFTAWRGVAAEESISLITSYTFQEKKKTHICIKLGNSWERCDKTKSIKRERNRNLVTGLSDVRSVKKRISLDSFFGREIGEIAATVNSGLVRSDVKIVSHGK